MQYISTINASERNVATLQSVSLIKKRDRCINFLYSGPANSGRTYLSLEVGYKFVNTSYTICKVCRVSCGMSMIHFGIIKVSLTIWSLARITTVIIFLTLKVWIRWAGLYFFIIYLCQVVWNFRTTKSEDCPGLSIEEEIVGFGVGKRLCFVLFSTTQLYD